MTDAPERIFASYRKQPEQLYAYPWPSHDGAAEYQYILATPAALAASPEVAALIREAEARGMERAAGMFTAKPWTWNSNEIQEKVRAEAAAIRAAKGEPE